MKNLNILFFLMLLSLNLFSQNKELLTNKTIVDLTKMGVSESTIIKKMKTSKCNFDVSVDGIINLKKNKVSSSVVDEMIRIVESTDGSLEPNTAKSGDQKAHHEIGIYLYEPNTKKMKKIDGSNIAATKSGGVGEVIANRYSYGVSNIKSRAILDGYSSRFQIENQSPVFYFYFKNNKPQQGNTSMTEYVYLSSEEFYFTSPSNPNQFALIKLKAKENTREFVTSAQNAYSSTVGTTKNVTVQFFYDKVEDGIYKVYFKEPLEDGEYTFLYSGEVPSFNRGNELNKTNFQMKVYDFSIYNRNNQAQE